MSGGALPPGAATIGVLGGGQLGRMLGLCARRLGYGFAVYSDAADGPAAAVADRVVVAPYTDLAAVEAFARSVDVVTFEFENVPAAAAEAAARFAPVRPDGRVLHLTQHRLREKTFLRDAGLPVTPFEAVSTPESLTAAVARLGTPCVLKTAGFGYDGKGQRRLDDARPETLAAALAATTGGTGEAAILEAFVPFERELSVVVARGLDGRVVCHPPFENVHRHHILDVTVCPARVPAPVAAAALALAERVVRALDVVGLLCVELFQLPGGALLINELAPRTHNSGHLTVEAAVTSQFEQQLRAVCGLPLGDASVPRPSAMANLLGDAWAGGPPDFAAALAVPGVALHLYGKREARPGRKMGHLTCVADSAEAAVQAVTEARARLRRGSSAP